MRLTLDNLIPVHDVPSVAGLVLPLGQLSILAGIRHFLPAFPGWRVAMHRLGRLSVALPTLWDNRFPRIAVAKIVQRQ